MKCESRWPGSTEVEFGNVEPPTGQFRWGKDEGGVAGGGGRLGGAASEVLVSGPDMAQLDLLAREIQDHASAATSGDRERVGLEPHRGRKCVSSRCHRRLRCTG